MPNPEYFEFFPAYFQRSDEFKEAWADWLADRLIRKHPVTVRAAKRQVKKLSEYTVKGAIAMIDQAIDCGYRTFYPVDGHLPRSQPAEPKEPVPVEPVDSGFVSSLIDQCGIRDMPESQNHEGDRRVFLQKQADNKK